MVSLTQALNQISDNRLHDGTLALWLYTLTHHTLTELGFSKAFMGGPKRTSRKKTRIDSLTCQSSGSDAVTWASGVALFTSEPSSIANEMR